MAIMESNEPFNPISGGVGGLVIGAAGAGGYIGFSKRSYDTIEKRHQKMLDKQASIKDKRDSYTEGSPNYQKFDNKLNKMSDKIKEKGTILEQAENHGYTKLRGGWKKTGIVAASAAGAGLLGAGAGYVNEN